jgi:integrase
LTLVICPESTHIWERESPKGVDFNEKVATEAGHAKRRYWDSRYEDAEVRTREYLTDAEVTKLIAAAGDNRNGHRDATMVLIAYRHGLRAAELVQLRWDAVDFNHARLHVSRAKNGSASVHPLTGREVRALRRLQRDQEPESAFVFTSERGAPFSTAGWRKMIARLGVAAKFDVAIHPHAINVAQPLRTPVSNAPVHPWP